MSGKRALVGVLVLVVALVVIRGIMIIGSPSEERTRRIDSRRVSDLQRISQSVEIYHSRHQEVPSSLDALMKEPGLANVPADPVTNEPYGYRAVDMTSYELCSTFDGDSNDSRAEGIWAHSAGRQCFTRTIKP
jgi:hypothetical protein